MTIYTECKSGIIQRGEELFPGAGFGTAKDYEKIDQILQIIPKNGERLMSTEEVLELYD